MEVVDNPWETLLCEHLVFRLQETERNHAYEWGPAWITAEWADDAVADREGIEVENGTRRFLSKSPTFAPLEDVQREILVTAYEEPHTLAFIELLYA